MKNQYFGDINDYRKYGLLRAVIGAGNFRLLVAWMLTPDDGSTDGKFISYLDNSKKWMKHDPVLFQALTELLLSGQQRRVSLIEQTDLLLQTKYFSSCVPDGGAERSVWFHSLMDRAQDCDFVFLDPDNGFEVKSKKYGNKNSSKYLYWSEVKALWGAGKSLLIYQHFIREKKDGFIQRILVSLKDATSGSVVEAFATKRVVFLMALQPEHHDAIRGIVESLEQNWAGQIRCYLNQPRVSPFIYS